MDREGRRTRSSAAPRGARLLWLALAAACGATLAPAPRARAFDVELDADTSFQIYEVRAPGARAFMARRRLLSRVSLRLAHDLGEPDGQGRVIRLTSEAQLRLEQDFGETCLVDAGLCVNAVDSEDLGAWQPLASDTRLDVPAVWVAVDGLPLGLAARLGRQLVLDEIGFARVDGLRVSAAPLHWLRAEVLSGLLVRGTSLAGTPRSELAGSLRLADWERVPWAAPPVDTWVVGAALEGGPGRWLQLRAVLRHMWEPEGDVLTRLGVSASSAPAPWLRLDGGLVLDLLTIEAIAARGSVAVGNEELQVRAAVERRVPRFDPGTIWAWFTVAPIDQVELGASWRASPDVSLGGSVRGRRAELGSEQGDDLDAGVEGWLQARVEGFRFSGSGFLWSGSLGPLAGVSLNVARPISSWLELAADVSVWHFDAPYEAASYGTVLSEILTGRIQVSRETMIVLELQHATSRMIGHRFRGIVAIRVSTWP